MSIGRFEKYTGQETEVILPQSISGKPLAVIASKAFLSCKSIERLVLPESLELVEDWGFAHMKNLREIVMPMKKIGFGRQVFLGCDSLERVSLYPAAGAGEGKELPGLDLLRASMFRFLPQESPESMMSGAIEGQKGWPTEYDEALKNYLHRSEDSGFEPAFIGWFDVEDVDDQKEKYILQTKKDKLRLAFQRLLVERMNEPEGSLRVSDALREQLSGIIVLYSELVEDWLCRDNVCGTDIRYYRIWQQTGGLGQGTIDRLLDRLPWEEPEIRAFLMEEKWKQERGENFFEGLSL